MTPAAVELLATELPDTNWQAPRLYRAADTLRSLSAQLEAANQRADTLANSLAMFQDNSRETWRAMQAMRNDINNHIPMPSLESDLLQGPDDSVFCATIAAAVIKGLSKAHAAGKADGLREAAGCIGHITRHEDLGAILALIPADTPAAKLTVQEAAKVLLETMTNDRKTFDVMVEQAEATRRHGASSERVIGNALRAIAGGKDE